MAIFNWDISSSNALNPELEKTSDFTFVLKTKKQSQNNTYSYKDNTYLSK